jgi:hypothetical protein
MELATTEGRIKAGQLVLLFASKYHNRHTVATILRRLANRIGILQW